ncbi:MAG: hypothetical protein M5U34_34105 [Chloroflexi bacterium]|nr:hypothetical protein [Chloroflexota bacterium]
MPQLKQRDVAFMDALLIGELVVEEDCLRIHDSNTDESTLVIWQADYFLNDNHGIVEIVDETGTVVARVGEMVYMGGGEQATVNNDELRESIPEQCGGPYWRMGQFLPEEYIPNVSKEWVEPTTPTPASSIPRMSVHTAQDVQRHFDEWPSAHKQRLSDDLLVIFTYPHPLGDWVGGALIYDVPSVSAVVLDFNGRFNPDLTHYEDEAGQARLEEILADTDPMQELQDEVVSRWLNPGSEGSLSVPCGQAVRAPS